MVTPLRRRSALQEIPMSPPSLTVATATFQENNNVLLLDESLLDNSPHNNSLSRSMLSPAPSPDELIIRQRGRRSISVTWSPPSANNNNPRVANNNHSATKTPKSPQKTPTKNSGQHLQMVLRSSPRKRLLMASETLQNGLNSFDKRMASPGKLLESTKKLRIHERSVAQQDTNVSLGVYLKGYTSEQLIDLILNKLVKDDAAVESKLRNELPLPDIRPMEQQLLQLKKNIYRSLPSSRLVKKTDSVAFSRASLHLIAFKTTIVENLSQLSDSCHYDALVDYVLTAWQYVRDTPIFENPSHNSVRRHCFKILSFHAKSALKESGLRLGEDRLRNFESCTRDMLSDCESISSCAALLDYLIKTFENNDF